MTVSKRFTLVSGKNSLIDLSKPAENLNIDNSSFKLSQMFEEIVKVSGSVEVDLPPHYS